MGLLDPLVPEPQVSLDLLAPLESVSLDRRVLEPPVAQVPQALLVKWV